MGTSHPSEIGMGTRSDPGKYLGTENDLAFTSYPEKRSLRGQHPAPLWQSAAAAPANGCSLLELRVWFWFSTILRS